MSRITSNPTVLLSQQSDGSSGIEGLCELLQCSKATAHRIKNSGVIKDAITQTGRKIVIDAQLALDLIQSSKKGGRRCKK